VKKFKPSSIGINFIKNTTIKQKSPYVIDGEKYAKKIYSIHKKLRKQGVFLELLNRKIAPFTSRIYRLYDCGASNGTTINIDAIGNVGPCKSFLCLKEIYNHHDVLKVIDTFKMRSPLFNDFCIGCFAQGICGNGCAYEAKTNGINQLIDKRACVYVKQFYKMFVEDVLTLNIEKANLMILENGYYKPSICDRKKILGNVRKNLMSLKQCIGHEI
jgi:uncharacterized protein